MITVKGITKISNAAPTIQRTLPPKNHHWARPANVPPSADTICIGAARLYIGGKNFSATGIPAFIVAGCCAMDMYTAAPKNVPHRNTAKNSINIIGVCLVVVYANTRQF